MKKFKLIRGVQINLLTLLMIVISIILVGIFANYRVQGSVDTIQKRCTECEKETDFELDSVASLSSKYHYYNCSICGYRYMGEHYGGTHENSGRCDVCGKLYLNHTIDYIIDWNPTATTHTAEYACAEPGCTLTITMTEENHRGGTHDNGGKCTVCEYQYQTHGQQQWGWYVETATTHQLKYTCVFEGCSYVYADAAQNHTRRNT